MRARALAVLRMVNADLGEADRPNRSSEMHAAERGGALSVISNTPFYLTSPLLFRLLASGGAVGRAVLTMQKEVGEKVLAPHGCKQYGILSVMLQLFAAPEALFDIDASSFRPQPKCTVSVLRFAPTATPGGAAAGADAIASVPPLASMKSDSSVTLQSSFIVD